MVHSISYRTTLCLCAMLLCIKAVAQSYVTYNHDATKMNQITVQEIGVGGLTPAFYYTLFHNSYQKSAASKNKLSFRTLAGVESYQQIDLADSIQASLTQRAEIEAFNIADRQIDIAWLAEGSKVNKKLSDFERISTASSVLEVRQMIERDGTNTTICSRQLLKKPRTLICQTPKGKDNTLRYTLI